jgi:hypothetical protein
MRTARRGRLNTSGDADPPFNSAERTVKDVKIAPAVTLPVGRTEKLVRFDPHLFNTNFLVGTLLDVALTQQRQLLMLSNAGR